MIATINCRPSVLNPYDRATFYGGGAAGYGDDPARNPLVPSGGKDHALRSHPGTRSIQPRLA